MSGGAGPGRLGEAIQPFLAVVGANVHLTELDVSGHAIGDKGAFALSRALQQNRTLRTLRLDQSNMTQAGLAALMRAVEHNKDIKLMPLVPFADLSRLFVQEARKPEALIAMISNAERAREKVTAKKED